MTEHLTEPSADPQLSRPPTNTPRFICDHCHLEFNSAASLSKHAEKFCQNSHPRAFETIPSEKERESKAQITFKRPGEMTLGELKARLESNMADLDGFNFSKSSLTDEKIHQLRELKVHRTQLRRGKEAKEGDLLNALEKLQAQQQRELRTGVVKENAQTMYQTVNRGHLQSIADSKKEEWQSVSKEYESLEMEEKKILEEIGKLKTTFIQPQGNKRQGSKSSLTGLSSIPEPSLLEEVKARRPQLQSLDDEHQKRMDAIDMEHKRLQQEKAAAFLGRRETNQVNFSSSSAIERLRREKSRGEARLKLLKDQLQRDEDMERQMENDAIPSPSLRTPSPVVEESRSVSRSTIESVDTYVDSPVVRDLRKARLYIEKGQGRRSVLRRRLRKIERKLHAQTVQPAMPAVVNPMSDVHSTLIWQQLRQLEAENGRIRKEMVQDRSAFPAGGGSVFDSDLQGLRADQMKELLILKHKLEVARQQGELRRLEFEMQNERLKLTSNRTALPLPVQNIDPALAHSFSSSDFYRPEEGFIVFWDFAVGLDPSFSRVCLKTTLYNGKKEVKATDSFPLVASVPPTAYQLPPGNMALLQINQPFIGCSPLPSYTLLVELKGFKRPPSSRQPPPFASGGDGEDNQTTPVGWTKVVLFDLQQRLVSGRWRLPLRVSPAVTGVSVAMLNLLGKSGSGAELCYRLVNRRDGDFQSTISVKPSAHFHTYRPPPSFTSGPTHLAVDQIVTAPMVVFDNYENEPEDVASARPETESEVSLDDDETPPQPKVSIDVAFQIDWVRRVGWGEARVCVTIYNSSRTPVKTADDADVVWSTGKIRSNFLEGVHEFGIRSPVFSQLSLDEDSILVVDFWLGKRRRSGVDGRAEEKPESAGNLAEDERIPADDYERDVEEELGGGGGDNPKKKAVQTMYEEEELVGWTAMTIVVPNLENESEEIQLNSGVHRLPLFDAVDRPELNDLVVPILYSETQPYALLADAEIKLRISNGVFSVKRPVTATSDFFDESRPSSPPEGAWIKKERLEFPWRPFIAGDDFDLYIDGARFLPDIATATRVSGRIMNYKYNKVGEKLDISTDIDLDSGIYEPRYSFRLHVQEARIPPTATLILRIYTRNRLTKDLTILGYSVFAIFVESGTDRQPGTDSSGLQLSLNEGAHQLRIHPTLPKLSKPMSASFLDDEPFVPCASLLVRLNATRVDDDDVSTLPRYNNGVYFSAACHPSPGENQLFAALANRPSLLVRQVMTLIGDGSEKRLTTDEGRRQWIKKRLWRYFEDAPADVDLTYVVKYAPASGISFSVDAACNLPWSKVTHILYSFAPPASYYSGKTDDPIRHTRRLDWDSCLQTPVWTDSFQFFGRRRLHRHMAIIIHLVALDFSGRRGKLRIVDEAWTAVQVFADGGYVYTDRYQLPLYQSKPNKSAFDYLRHYETKIALRELSNNRKIKPLSGASVFVRIADGRRRDEVLLTQQPNDSYLPDEGISKYAAAKSQQQKTARSLLPKDESAEDFESRLMTELDERLANLLAKQRAK